MNRQEMVAQLQAIYRRQYSVWAKFAFLLAILSMTVGIAKSNNGLIFTVLILTGASARTFFKESD